MSAFARFFRSSRPARDKYLSRLFGLISEDVVRYWCRCPGARYEDLGRPTLRASGETRGYTLDFTLRERIGGKVYVAESKCELEFEAYRYLTLNSPGQLAHHRSPAFQRFQAIALAPLTYAVYVHGKPVTVDGAILVWGAVTPEGSEAVKQSCGFADVLSLEAMLEDLHRWQPAEWQAWLAERRAWGDELFDFLAGSDQSNGLGSRAAAPPS